MPSEARDMPASIIVVGDGPVGLAAAIALRGTLPRTDITIVPCQPDPAALADRAITVMPQSARFHERFGLEEIGLLTRAGASHRLGVRFCHWQHTVASYIHGYGAYGQGGGSVSQSLADSNYFTYPADNIASPLSDIDYALRFNQPAYRRHLAGLARHLGVFSAKSELASTIPSEAGGLKHITLTSGELITADIFVDCTGPQALLANAAKQAPFDDWSTTLPCDTICVKTTEPAGLCVVDSIEAHPFGWRSVVNGRDATYTTYGFNSSTGSEEHVAQAMGRQDNEIIPIRPGRLKQCWSGNVVALGDASATFEPLQWINLTLAHEQILLFLDLLPGRGIDALERAEFNRRSGAMADRVRDFIALHYASAAHPTGEFWAHAASLQRSESLDLTLSQYRRRGRLPFFEEEILPREAWLSAMDSIGALRGPNAQSISTPSDVIAERLHNQQMRSRRAMQLAMPYPAWMQNQIGGRA